MEKRYFHPDDQRVITEIILHCAASPEDKIYTVQQLYADHIARGMKCIGYNYFIPFTGEIIRTRPHDINGAHCYGHNTHSIGICLEGGLRRNPKTGLYEPADTRTFLQKRALSFLIPTLRFMYKNARVVGHRDVASNDRNGNGIIEPCERIKECPCFDVEKSYNCVIAWDE